MNDVTKHSSQLGLAWFCGIADLQYDGICSHLCSTSTTTTTTTLPQDPRRTNLIDINCWFISVPSSTVLVKPSSVHGTN